jgi:hypothetical protein
MRWIGSAVVVFVCVLSVRMIGGDAAQPASMVAVGRDVFRYDTFGDEQLWTDTLRLHEVVEGLDPTTALGVGLKVDAAALSPGFVKALVGGKVSLTDPRTTRRLLEMNAVVGVVGKIVDDRIKSLGVTCALCHSTVDNSFAPGIGKRLDGWPNMDLDVGLIASLSPFFDDKPALRTELQGWGPGKYDPRHRIFDGTSIVTRFTPTLPVVLPPAFGLQNVGFETYTGDGPISYWNAYVAVTQMGGHGNFSDPRIKINIVQKPDLVTSKLAVLLAYQLSLHTPPPPPNSFDSVAAAQGETLFNGIAGCAACHIPPTYTDVLSGSNPKVPLLHGAGEIGADPTYASRSATQMYRTTPLRALWQHPPYFHDGRATTLLAVVDHYDQLFGLNLTAQQKSDLVEFLKSL